MVLKNGQSLSFDQNFKWKSTPFQSNWFVKNQRILSDFTLISFNHGRGPYGPNDEGGLFYLKKNSYSVKAAAYKKSTFDGLAFVNKPASYTLLTKQTASTESQMNTFGTTAIARSAPTNPAFQGATFLGELREGAPRAIGSGLLKSKARDLRKVGDEYLNVEFGWEPFRNDVIKFCYAVKNSHKILQQYLKASDTKIRRRYYGPRNEQTNAIAFSNGIVSPSEANTFAPGYLTDYKLPQSWFSGAFRYHIPMGNGMADRFHRYESEANRLLGTRITPEVVWNLTPWSWAVDWFSDTGDVIHNISVLGSDGLVLQYGYAMNKTLHRFSIIGTLPNGNATSYSFEEKELWRRPATPYGFGIDLHALSSKQVAVMAALGLSRS